MRNLMEALEIATEAALEAGRFLRLEFECDAGPRGHGDHADADIEAERLIRTRLTTRFPEDGFLGEETGAHAGTSGAYTWVVDPNDGTHSYLIGHRGPSVAIGLVFEGEPVLGVVFAHSAPDGRGDLIAGGRGLGLWRNGTPVPKRTLQEAPRWDSIVLTPLSTLRWSAAAAGWLAPSRFRAVASVAYRLALAAVGDGDVALSRGRLSSWDYAAGHALLLAAGGVLVDGEGLTPVYGPDGVCNVTGVYGGAAGFVESIRTRTWPRPRGASAVYPAVDFAARTGFRVTADAEALGRAQGALLGQLAGDSLGSLVEFRSAASIGAEFPKGPGDLRNGGTWNTLAGQPTDDSELALALARSILARGGYSRSHASESYVAWFRSHPFDVGTATTAALGRGTPNGESQANGALMRVIPLAIAGTFAEEAALAAAARADASITHPHRVCGDANVVFTAAAAFAIRTGATPVAIYDHALDVARRVDVHPVVREALEGAAHSPPAEFMAQMGWLTIAFRNAFYRLLHSASLEAGIRETVACGGDTDTNGAIAGALLGAAFGRQAVPDRWTRLILTCRPVLPETLSPLLPYVAHPRPEEFWPVDALEVAERLLTTGL